MILAAAAGAFLTSYTVTTSRERQPGNFLLSQLSHDVVRNK